MALTNFCLCKRLIKSPRSMGLSTVKPKSLRLTQSHYSPDLTGLWLLVKRKIAKKKKHKTKTNWKIALEDWNLITWCVSEVIVQSKKSLKTKPNPNIVFKHHTKYLYFKLNFLPSRKRKDCQPKGNAKCHDCRRNWVPDTLDWKFEIGQLFSV
jgi:hypothetical protein